MHRVEIVAADITTLAVDAIVNAANERMLGGGGVDGAIHRAAGPELLAACRAVPEVRPGVRCPTGECRLTPGFALPAGFVIHTVGPVWRGGGHGEAEQLASCYRSALQVAREHDLTSIAFPAISCGVYGYPPAAAAAVARATIERSLAGEPSPDRVLLVAFGRDVQAALRAAFARNCGRARGCAGAILVRRRAAAGQRLSPRWRGAQECCVGPLVALAGATAEGRSGWDLAGLTNGGRHPSRGDAAHHILARG